MTEAKAALLGPVEIRELAARLDVTPTKKLGQNFLHDPNTIRRIVAAADLDRSDRVVEVGPAARAIATLDDGTVVAVRQGGLLATAFHPEVSGETRFHALFLDTIGAA